MIVKRLQWNLPGYSVSPAVVFQGDGKVSSVVTLAEGWLGGRAWLVRLTRGRGRDHRVPLAGGDREGGDKTVVVSVIWGKFTLKKLFNEEDIIHNNPVLPLKGTLHDPAVGMMMEQDLELDKQAPVPGPGPVTTGPIMSCNRPGAGARLFGQYSCLLPTTGLATTLWLWHWSEVIVVKTKYF